MTFELNFWTESAQTLPLNWRMTPSLNRLSLRSKMYWTTCRSKRVSCWAVGKGRRITYVVAVRVLHEREGVVRDLLDQLDTLAVRGVVNAALENAAAVTVSGDLNAVLRDGVVDELYHGMLNHTSSIQTSNCHKHTWLSSGASLLRHFWMTWLPLRSLMSVTTCRPNATMMARICDSV